MGHVGLAVQLRPLCGGREWDVPPGQLRELSPAEALSARLKAQNRLTRQRAMVQDPAGSSATGGAPRSTDR